MEFFFVFLFNIEDKETLITIRNFFLLLTPRYVGKLNVLRTKYRNRIINYINFTATFNYVEDSSKYIAIKLHAGIRVRVTKKLARARLTSLLKLQLANLSRCSMIHKNDARAEERTALIIIT